MSDSLAALRDRLETLITDMVLDRDDCKAIIGERQKREVSTGYNEGEVAALSRWIPKLTAVLSEASAARPQEQEPSYGNALCRCGHLSSRHACDHETSDMSCFDCECEAFVVEASAARPLSQAGYVSDEGDETEDDFPPVGASAARSLPISREYVEPTWPAPLSPQECGFSTPRSTRVCERGTVGCVISHDHQLAEPTRTHLGWLLAKVMKDPQYPEARVIWEKWCDFIDTHFVTAAPGGAITDLKADGAGRLSAVLARGVSQTTQGYVIAEVIAVHTDKCARGEKGRRVYKGWRCICDAEAMLATLLGEPSTLISVNDTRASTGDNT